MTSTETVTERDSTSNEESTRMETRVVVEKAPSTKPVIAWLVATVVVGLSLVAAISAKPGLFGNVRIAEIAANLVLALTAIGTIRLLVRWYVLTRTRYVVTTSGVRREYTLLYRTWSRELPLEMIRGHELTRSRVETLLGVGTVEFLSGSVAGSIGHLRFSHLPNPQRVRAAVQDQLTTTSGGDGA